jgi:hypothetical protein
MTLSTETRETREFASEIKFLIDPDLAARIHAWARERLAPDPYASAPPGDQYHTTTMYFDTARFDVFHRRGSFGRSKYRVRRYGASDAAFLERKLRTADLVTKRRTFVPLDDLFRLAEAGDAQPWPGRWFQQRLLARRLEPTCQVTYRRTARVAMTNYGPVRLTLDHDLAAAPAAGLAFSAAAAAPVLEGQVILELKYRVAMPLIFKQLAEAFSLQPRPVSKYRTSVAALGYATADGVNGAAPAGEETSRA